MTISKGDRVLTCYNCEKYPLCRVLSIINKAIDEGIFTTDTRIKCAIAESCKYYKGVK